MKALFGSDFKGYYRFDSANSKIVFTQLEQPLDLSNFLVITNATRNIIIYNFADSAKGAASFNGQDLMLDYNTSAMANSDVLQIYIDVQREDPSLLRRMFALLMSPLGYDKSLQRYRNTVVLESGTVSTVSTVAAVTTLATAATLTNLGTLSSERLVLNENTAAWTASHRARIT
jgi:hypothetical protein